jgi:hypothetical protein
VIKPEIQRFEDVEYNKLVKPHHKGEQRDILFGHGLALEDVLFLLFSSRKGRWLPAMTFHTTKESHPRPKSTPFMSLTSKVLPVSSTKHQYLYPLFSYTRKATKNTFLLMVTPKY